MPGYLIKDTTEDERRQIVEDALGNMDGLCDGCAPGLADMYDAYIAGEKELREINMEFHRNMVVANPEEAERNSCLR